MFGNYYYLYNSIEIDYSYELEFYRNFKFLCGVLCFELFNRYLFEVYII